MYVGADLAGCVLGEEAARVHAEVEEGIGGGVEGWVDGVLGVVVVVHCVAVEVEGGFVAWDDGSVVAFSIRVGNGFSSLFGLGWIFIDPRTIFGRRQLISLWELLVQTELLASCHGSSTGTKHSERDEFDEVLRGTFADLIRVWGYNVLASDLILGIMALTQEFIAVSIVPLLKQAGRRPR